MSVVLFNIEKVSFYFPNSVTPVLRDIQVEVRRGEMVVLSGESGSGKSTLLSLLKKEVSPKGHLEGNIQFKGQQLTDLSKKESATKIGYVMQQPDRQLVTDRVWTELAFGMENSGIPQEEMHRRVAEMVTFFGMNDWYHREVSQLSSGQKQLVNLAAVMVMQPEVLLLDEPMSQLDPMAKKEFISVIRRLNEELGMTIILSDHDLSDSLTCATQWWVLSKGRFIGKGSPKETAKQLLESRGMSDYPLVLMLQQAINPFVPPALHQKEFREMLLREQASFLPSLDKTEPLINSPVVLTWKKLFFRYERASDPVLSGVSGELRVGEILGLTGGNGSGKTTLLTLLSGIRKPNRGRINHDRTLIVGYVPQNPLDLFVEETVLADYTGYLKHLRVDDSNARIRRVVEQLEIGHLLHRHPFDLSGGEAQCVALGKVLLKQPTLLCLDEPTKGMDQHIKNKVVTVLESLQGEGCAMVIVSHDTDFLATVTTKCGMLFDGEIVSQIGTRDFFKNNVFFTTSVAKLMRPYFPDVLTLEDVRERVVRKEC